MKVKAYRRADYRWIVECPIKGNVGLYDCNKCRFHGLVTVWDDGGGYVICKREVILKYFGEGFKK